MKKLIPLILLAVAATVYVFFGTTVADFSKHKFPQKDSIFIQTHWKQMGGFETLTPDHLRLGCWSTALAQIMYFHHLKPFGHVAYRSRKGYVIDENIDSTKINFARLALQIDKNTEPKAIEALALYNYYAALAVNKDFGTDNYMHKLAPASLFESHYQVKASRYVSWQGLLPYSRSKLEKVVMQEISEKRPLFLHFANLKNFGHSVVIDGYKCSGELFFVHLNQGQGGSQDGWYDFDKDLLAKDDLKLRVVYAFKPLKSVM